MSPANLSRALAFELPKLMPLPADTLRWGFRVVGDGATAGQRHLRLAGLRADDWSAWLEAASGLPNGVDAIVPPGLGLDPLLAGVPACFTCGPTGEGYQLAPDETGLRQVLPPPGVHASGTVFGWGETPLAHPRLELGPLAERPAPEQSRYAPAVLLALYGLTGSLHDDLPTWITLPAEMRPRRNRALKLATVALSLYLIVIIAVLASRTLLANHQELTRLNSQLQQVRQEQEALRKEQQRYARVQELQDVLLRQMLEHRSVVDALAELTTSLDSRLWANRLAWNQGEVQLGLAAATDAPDLLGPLAQLEVFASFRQDKKQVGTNGQVTYDVTLQQKKLEDLVQPGAPPVKSGAPRQPVKPKPAAPAAEPAAPAAGDAPPPEHAPAAAPPVEAAPAQEAPRE
jgi:hypothetical protein